MTNNERKEEILKAAARDGLSIGEVNLILKINKLHSLTEEEKIKYHFLPPTEVED